MLQFEKNINDNIYFFNINGDVNTDILNQFYNQIELKFTEENSLRVLGTLNDTPSLKDFNIFREAVLSKVNAFQKDIKYAIVTDQNWMFKLVDVTNFFTPNITLRIFTLEEKQIAIDWLKN